MVNREKLASHKSAQDEAILVISTYSLIDKVVHAAVPDDAPDALVRVRKEERHAIAGSPSSAHLRRSKGGVFRSKQLCEGWVICCVVNSEGNEGMLHVGVDIAHGSGQWTGVGHGKHPAPVTREARNLAKIISSIDLFSWTEIRDASTKVRGHDDVQPCLGEATK